MSWLCVLLSVGLSAICPGFHGSAFPRIASPATSADSLADPAIEQVSYAELRFLVGRGPSTSSLARGAATEPAQEASAAATRRVDPGATRAHEKVALAPDGDDAEHAACFVTGAESSTQPFHDLLISWNCATPAGTGFVVELSVKSGGDPWSDWLFVGDWGDVPALSKVLSCTGGKVDTDFFRGEKLFDSARVRVRAFANASATKREVVIERLALCFSDRKSSVARIAEIPRVAASKRALDVPFRSQKSEKPEIAGRICSPTSLSMVLAYRGVDQPTGVVAARAYDAANDIYGNWPRNIQAAYSFGVPGYLTRCVSWSDVEDMIATGQPVIASIAVKEGQLAGAPYAKTDGHLLVITGFDEDGNVHVNDPAVADPARGKLVYKRADMQTVWLDRGGTAYVLTEKP
jgi:hypothetical protein